MHDPRLSRMAEILVKYSTRIKEGDKVKITGQPVSIPLLEQIYIEALKAGGHPFVDISLPSINQYFYKYANKKQLSFVSPIAKTLIKNYDVAITIMSEENVHRLSGVDPKKQAMRSLAMKNLGALQMKRMASGETRTCIALFPTNAYASTAEMSLEDFEDFVFRACYVDHKNPLKKWKEVKDHQNKVIKFLTKFSKIRVVAPGTDISFSYKNRGWMNCDGQLNFPDGEVFTCPVENSANGIVKFTYPACFNGREVENVELTFDKGIVVKATASKNQEFLTEMLNTDTGARKLGEFAIGTNKGVDRFTKNILFDEKIAGTVHFAVGLSAPGCGGKNKSSIHWDMVCDLRKDGKIYADDKLFYKNGKFIDKKLQN
jgi:aminopeptidase